VHSPENLGTLHVLITDAFQLSHGARPDYRDSNHRTSIQYSLRHPLVLWCCEEALRKHRALESQVCRETLRVYRHADFGQRGNKRKLRSSAQADVDRLSPLDHSRPLPLPHLFSEPIVFRRNSSLVNAIVTGDVPLLLSFLFPALSSSDVPRPILVNCPDGDDWSLIHYCVSVRQPSIEVLDILYRAGADVSLFSEAGACTPLHCLARKKRGPDSLRGLASIQSLYQFVVHLIRDLRAPLGALDHNKETCIHMAAEHGDSAEVLRAFLDCDTDGAVRDLRNSRGSVTVYVRSVPILTSDPQTHCSRRCKGRVPCSVRHTGRAPSPCVLSVARDSEAAALVGVRAFAVLAGFGRDSHAAGPKPPLACFGPFIFVFDGRR